MSNSKYQKYISWISKPKEMRRPATLAEFLEENKLTMSDIIAFQERPTFTTDRYAKIVANVDKEIPEVIQSMLRKVKSSPKTSDIKTLIDLITEYQTKSIGIEEYDFTETLTRGQILTLIDELEKLLAKQG